jgi:hypothetical protein
MKKNTPKRKREDDPEIDYLRRNALYKYKKQETEARRNAEKHISKVLDQLENRTINKLQAELLGQTYKEDIEFLLSENTCVFCGRVFNLLSALGSYDCPGPLYGDEWTKRVRTENNHFDKHYETVPLSARTHFPERLTSKYTVNSIVSKDSIKLNFALFWYFRYLFKNETENLRDNINRLIVVRANQSRKYYSYDLQNLLDEDTSDMLQLPTSINVNTTMYRMHMNTIKPISEIIIKHSDVTNYDKSLLDSNEHFFVDLGKSYVTYRIYPSDESH